MTENVCKRFVQIHALVSYPPSNLNRDDIGRPKTAVMGGKQRLRISSQSIKRAWRESEYFADALSGHVGYRTKLLGEKVKQALLSGSSLSGVLAGSVDAVNPVLSEADAEKTAQLIAGIFAKTSEKSLKSEQLVHVSHDEIQAIDVRLAKIAAAGKAPDEVDVSLLNPVSDVDIALFGRMIASAPKYGVEAAAQVAHPITIHPVVIEDDYFTAVDDLNVSEDVAGAAHLGVCEYGAGIFYTYVCINRELLVENLGGDAELASRAIMALIECVAKIGPKGKQNTFGSRVYASYMLVEQGNQQPRSLAAAFLAPFKSDNFLAEGVERLEAERMNLEKVYGFCADVAARMNVSSGDGSLAEILASVKC